MSNFEVKYRNTEFQKRRLPVFISTFNIQHSTFNILLLNALGLKLYSRAACSVKRVAVLYCFRLLAFAFNLYLYLPCSLVAFL
jgi:hypothetical protein